MATLQLAIMQSLVEQNWNWSTTLSNMAEGTMDRLATPASSDSQSQTALPTPERTPTHGAARAPTSDEICAGDQGIWHMSSSEFWPVLVLRQEMVPDSLRRSPEDESQVPVFLLAKDSM